MTVQPPYSIEQLRAMLDHKVSVTTPMGTGYGMLRAVDEERVTISLEWAIGELHDTLEIDDIQEIKPYDAG
jgi:hypothetical protein